MLASFAVMLLLSEAPAPAPAVQAGSVALTAAELEKLGPVTAEWDDHGTKKQAYGVPLAKVLARIGFVAPEKKVGWRKVLIATGADGYVATFSTAELSETVSGVTKALLVWKVDGKPLTKEQGDFRLVVLTDKTGARSVYQLKKLELVER